MYDGKKTGWDNALLEPQLSKEVVDKYGGGLNVMDMLNATTDPLAESRRRIEAIMKQTDTRKVKIDKFPITLMSVYGDKIYACFKRNLELKSHVVFPCTYFEGERDLDYEYQVVDIQKGVHILMAWDSGNKLKESMPIGLNVWYLERELGHWDINFSIQNSNSSTHSFTIPVGSSTLEEFDKAAKEYAKEYSKSSAVHLETGEIKHGDNAATLAAKSRGLI